MADRIYTDIAIIGAGASGITAAIAASENYTGKISLIEKMPRIGKKILSTGNGRCNLSNTNINADFYSGEQRLLRNVQKYLPDSKNFFAQLGLAVKADKEGRLYPYSMAASSVLDCLRFAVAAAGVEINTDCKVLEIKAIKNNFEIKCESCTFLAKRVIISTGGCASPSLGSTGDGFKLAGMLGHTVTEIYPGLAPLRTDVSKVKAIKGLRVSAKATLIINDKNVAEETGEVQFSDGALSGICIFNLSDIAAKNIGKCEISLDIAPEYECSELKGMIASVKRIRKNLPAEELLTGLFHKRIGMEILKAAGCSPAVMCGKISDSQIDCMIKLIKDWRFKITGVSDYSLAQITSGGINSKEIDDNLQSKICKGLYFCGEITDVQGKCGGYNLDYAWKSGYCAGTNAALSLK